jgi:uncharacterized protein (TIGR02466 family)
VAILDRLFATTIYRSTLLPRGGERLRRDLEKSCLAIAATDIAGRSWSKAHNYKGYTSYASLNDLAWRDPVFAELVLALDRHVADFARGLDLDLGSQKLALDSLWINVLEPGGMHAAHIHPKSVVSGTYYVALPAGAAGLKFEDPRLGLMMAAPPRRMRARRHNRTFVEVRPRPGQILLWESYLRHEVPPTGGTARRISISFNYGLD